MTSWGWVVVVGLALAGCPAPEEEDPGDGRGEVPRALEGGWYAGEVSDTHIIDTGGGFRNVYGTGLVYRFFDDGSYEKSVLLQRADGFCSGQFLGYSRGFVTIEGDEEIALHPTSGKIKSVDSCVADWNYERRDVPDAETLYWRRADDGAGRALMMRAPTTGVTLFRPAD
jgi:hypothetical protein